MIPHSFIAGSCWAFAATDAIESMYLMNVDSSVTSTLSLSPQQLVSCCNSGNGGCAYSSGCYGGYSDEAINFVSAINQTTSSIYPYTSGAGNTGLCSSAILSSTKTGQAVKLSGSATSISPSNSEATLMQAVAIAPTIVYFDAQMSFQLYSGGVYSASDCSANINHAGESKFAITIVSRCWIRVSCFCR